MQPRWCWGRKGAAGWWGEDVLGQLASPRIHIPPEPVQVALLGSRDSAAVMVEVMLEQDGVLTGEGSVDTHAGRRPHSLVVEGTAALFVAVFGGAVPHVRLPTSEISETGGGGRVPPCWLRGEPRRFAQVT